MQSTEAAVVTGASSGIGEACARRLLDGGISVVTLQRSPPRLKHTNLHYRQIDLADLAATQKLADEVAAEFPVRYLVNNAGANRPALLEDATIDDFE
jgi:NADP-dependent 3-hydroxy acid dehydrogenase YdfG